MGWRRRDKHRRPHCDLHLGHNSRQCHWICLFIDTVTAQTDNTIYLADSNDLTGLCEEGGGRGLIKARPLYFLGKRKTFTQTLTPNILRVCRSSNWAPQQQKSSFSRLNSCHISEELAGDGYNGGGVLKDVTLLRERGDMSILRVRKDFALLREWGTLLYGRYVMISSHYRW